MKYKYISCLDWGPSRYHFVYAGILRSREAIFGPKLLVPVLVSQDNRDQSGPSVWHDGETQTGREGGGGHCGRERVLNGLTSPGFLVLLWPSFHTSLLSWQCSLTCLAAWERLMGTRLPQYSFIALFLLLVLWDLPEAGHAPVCRSRAVSASEPVLSLS